MCTKLLKCACSNDSLQPTCGMLLRLQQAQAAASVEAVNQVLLGLPLPQDGDTEHHANMLRLLGSISDIR